MKQNKKKRVLSSVLAASMVFGMTPAAFASDIDGHWAQEPMEKFISKNYIAGFGNDVYAPDQPMTRAQFAALINRITELKEMSSSIENYSDVAVTAWYRDDLAKALQAGYMAGTSATTMSPENTITREQAMSMIVRMLEVEGADESVLDRFSDKDDLSDYAVSAAAAAVGAGYVVGNEKGELQPKKELTRAEGVAMLDRALDALIDAGNGSDDDTDSDNNPTTPIIPGGGGGGTANSVKPVNITVAGNEYSYVTRATNGYEQIGSTGVYYKAVDDELADDAVYYGTATLSYSEFYAGDADSAEGYDVVSSATTDKSTIFENGDSTEPVENEGYTINGVKNVAVGVDAQLYVEAMILQEAKSSAVTGAYAEAAAVELNEDPTEAVAQYKPLNEDGSYDALVTNVLATIDDANPVLSTSSRWGDYQINVNETSTSNLRNDRNTGWPVGENILGAVVEATKDGETIKVGMQHLQNIWIQPYQIAFNVEGDNGNIADTSKLVGATVNKITYIVPEGSYVYNFEDGVYVKPVYEEKVVGAFEDNNSVFTLQEVPSELTNPQLTVTYTTGSGRTAVTHTLYSGDAQESVQLSALPEDAAEGGTYSATITSDNYADIVVDLEMTAAQRAELEELIAEGEALVAADSSLTILAAHVQEAKELLENSSATSADASELIAELNDLIAAAQPDSIVMEVEAPVEGFGYNAKLKVTYAQDGTILSVVDNGTVPGNSMNEMFWNNAVAMLDNFAGKTASEINDIDGVSGATLSSNAIRDAVKKVFP